MSGKRAKQQRREFFKAQDAVRQSQQNINVSVDLAQITNMKCMCGCENFRQVFILKFISGFYTGNNQPDGRGLPRWVCDNLKCGIMYPAVLSRNDVKEYYESGRVVRIINGKYLDVDFNEIDFSEIERAKNG